MMVRLHLAPDRDRTPIHNINMSNIICYPFKTEQEFGIRQKRLPHTRCVCFGLEEEEEDGATSGTEQTGNLQRRRLSP